MPSYAKESYFGRRFLNTMFGRVNKRPDNECREMEKFIIGTISGAEFGGRDVRNAYCVFLFNKKTGTNNEMWRHWFENRENGWPVLEKQGDNVMWTWFKSSRQMGGWAKIGEECVITFKLEIIDGRVVKVAL